MADWTGDGLLDLVSKKLQQDGVRSLARAAPRYAYKRTARTLYTANNWQYTRQEGAGSDVMAEDWDVLIVLDACRYDVFQDIDPLEGDLSSFLSAGSSSKEWIEQNFIGEQHHDTVYISGNAYTPDISDDVFHSIRTVTPRTLDESELDLDADLPDDSYVVLPEDMVSEALAASDEFPNKRLIVHMMQPHVPLIGPTGLSIYEDFYEQTDAETHRRHGRGSRFGALSVKLHQAIQTGTFEVSDERLLEAYRETLELAIPYVETLIQEIGGKTVVTADHGELLGEQVLPFGSKLYGHKDGVRCDELCRVPWLVVSDETRRRVAAEPPVESDRLSEDEEKEQLEALGYL